MVDHLLSTPSMPAAPAQAALDQALAHHQANRLEAARSGYAKVRQLAPRLFEGYYLGGLVALQLAQPQEAAPLLQTATQLNPQHALSFHCLGNALLLLGRREEAKKAIERTLRLNPKMAEAWSNLGALHAQSGEWDAALRAYQQALEIAPKSADGWCGLASTCLLAGRPEEALAASETALSLAAQHPRAGLCRAQSLFQLCRLREAGDAFRAHLACHPGDRDAHSQRLLLLNYDDTLAAEAIAQEHFAFGDAFSRSSPPADRPAPRTGPVRLGFISPDLRHHSVAYFLEPLLRNLDRSRFSVWLYHDHSVSDAVTRRLQQLADGFRLVVGQPDALLARQIQADRIDVLVDLAGHTGSNRMGLFSQRVTPLQATYLGYPNTTGLPTMDLRLVDALTDPTGQADRLHREQLVRFSPCAWAYQPPAEAPECTSTAGNTDPVVFGSFNNANKLSDSTLRTWSALLARLPDARLVIKSSGLEPERFQRRLASFNFDLKRVELLRVAPTTAEHLELYRRIDIALDSFPYHGTTTTCEALYMGVPVIVRAGDRHASRVGVSLLHAVGHPEWIAGDEQGYLDCAVALAGDLAAVRGRRPLLRQAVLEGPLGRHQEHARHFGAALQEALHAVRAPAESPA